jgi:antitoxin VapB
LRNCILVEDAAEGRFTAQALGHFVAEQAQPNRLSLNTASHRFVLRRNLIYCKNTYHLRSALMDTAKIFWTGRSQAVRLPKEFRFDASEVRVRKQGESVILEPIASDWAWLAKVTGPLDQDFVDATLEKPAAQKRPRLDLFK